MLCMDRWNDGKRSRTSRKIVDLSDSDASSDDEAPGPAKKYGNKFVPFGQANPLVDDDTFSTRLLRSLEICPVVGIDGGQVPSACPQVVAASGSSVRVSVSCSAGLASELPIWALSMRGDADWAIRALIPENAMVLREGEHALVQVPIAPPHRQVTGFRDTLFE